MPLPSRTTVFVFVMFTYFAITGGVIYDMINEPPAIGSTVDERGNQRPTAILVGRVNAQYIMEGLAAAFMFLAGGVGFIVFDKANDDNISRTQRISLLAFAFSSVLISFIATRTFISIKMPGYSS